MSFSNQIPIFHFSYLLRINLSNLNPLFLVVDYFLSSAEGYRKAVGFLRKPRPICGRSLFVEEG